MNCRNGTDIAADEVLAKHKDWVDEFVPTYESITSENIDEILEAEIGKVFCKVLEHAGVYKKEEDFLRFVESVNHAE